MNLKSNYFRFIRFFIINLLLYSYLFRLSAIFILNSKNLTYNNFLNIISYNMCLLRKTNHILAY